MWVCTRYLGVTRYTIRDVNVSLFAVGQCFSVQRQTTGNRQCSYNRTQRHIVGLVMRPIFNKIYGWFKPNSMCPRFHVEKTDFYFIALNRKNASTFTLKLELSRKEIPSWSKDVKSHLPFALTEYCNYSALSSTIQLFFLFPVFNSSTIFHPHIYFCNISDRTYSSNPAHLHLIPRAICHHAWQSW